MERLKQKITIENALCLFIIICPLLDMASFIFRNAFNTNFSPSTFIRPIITIVVALIIFVKCKFKRQNDISWNSLCYIWNSAFGYISKTKNRDVI